MFDHFSTIGRKGLGEGNRFESNQRLTDIIEKFSSFWSYSIIKF